MEIGVDDDADAGDLVNYNKLLVCQFLCSLAPAGIYRNWKIVIFHLGLWRREYATDKVLLGIKFFKTSWSSYDDKLCRTAQI